MERDFMGLSSRQPLRKVKPELHHVSGISKSSGMEWAKFYGPQNFKSARELHEARTSPTSSVMKRSHLGGANQNAAAAAANAKPLLLGGVPMTSPSPLLPTLNSFAGFTDPRNNVASSAPQLTVFYGGTVNVFNDISPEKAQAIMLWAANGLSLSSMTESPKGKNGDVVSKKPMEESERRRAYGKHSLNASPNAVAAAAVSASSSSGTHSAESVSVSIDKPGATKAIDLMGSFCVAANMIPSVPQARKASLARFLEKRKERLMNAMPYSVNKMKLMECSTGESSGMNYSATSAAIQQHLKTIIETVH